MSTMDGADQRSFWSTAEIDIFHGAPFQLTGFMSQKWFENILMNLGYTNGKPPAFCN